VAAVAWELLTERLNERDRPKQMYRLYS
jgi:hypothetical protein